MTDKSNLLGENEYYDEYTGNVSEFKINIQGEITENTKKHKCCKNSEKTCKARCCKSEKCK